MSLTEIDSKLKDMLDRDEKYNLIMKYSHKITDPDNLKNLKTLISKEISIKIENSLNGKSKIYFIKKFTNRQRKYICRFI